MDFAKRGRKTDGLQSWKENIVIVDAARTPFNMSGTDFKNLKPHDLTREAIRGVMDKTGLQGDQVDYVCMGTVIQEVKTSNVAREAVMRHQTCSFLEECKCSHLVFLLPTRLCKLEFLSMCLRTR